MGTLNRYCCLISWVICLLATSYGCRKPADETPEAIVFTPEEMVLITNEGNFQWGNASASLVHLSSDQFWGDAFKMQNKRPLGDVLQSASHLGNEWWLVMNNSGKIETVSTTDFKSTGTITGLTSPRYALYLPVGKVLVSDLYANGIAVVDVATRTKTGFIPVPGWTEEMVFTNDQVWVVSKTRPLIYIIHATTLTLVDSLSLPGKGTSIKNGPSGTLWIGYEGDETHPGGILLIDASSKTTGKSWSISGNHPLPDRFETSATSDSLFFTNQGAYT